MVGWIENMKFSLDVAKKYRRAVRYFERHPDLNFGDTDEYTEAYYEFYDARDWFQEKSEKCNVDFIHLLQAASEMKDFSSPYKWKKALERFGIGFYDDFVNIREVERVF